MKPGQIPIRLFAEILLILLLVQSGLLWLVPAMGGPFSPLANALLALGALVLVCGPAIYWRCMHATRTAAALARAGGRPDNGLVARRDDRQELRRRHAVAMTTVANLSGLALTFGAAMAMQSRLNTEAQQQFDRQFERLEREIARRFRQPVNGLKGARAVYASSQSVERGEFRAFVDARSLATDYPGVLGFGFIQRVPRDALDRFIADERADEAPDFTVRTSGDAPDLYVIKFIEPLAPNFSARGYDVSAEPARRAAVEAAIASGEPTLSTAIQLVQDAKAEPGYLYLMPIFRHGTDPMTAEQRRAALVGLVYTPIVVADLLAGANDAADVKLDFELFDGDGTDTAQLVHDADGHLRAVRPGSSSLVDAARYAGRRIEASHSLPVGGRLLTLRASTTPAFEAAQDRSAIAYIALGGAMLTFLLSLAVWSLAAGRVRALALAQRMTVELDRLAEVVRHTSNAVNITDRQLRINWVNEGFTRVTGYSAEDAIGKTPGELLGHPKASPATLARLATAAAAGEPCRVEILNRTKDGRDFWIDTEVQPIRDASGEVTGFMEIGTDITEQRRALEQLEDAQRENSALLRAIHAHAIVSVTDRAGRIVDVNDQFCRISGYHREELIGQNHRIINSGHMSKDAWREVWRTITAGQPWRGEVCNRAKDGSLYWVDAVIVPFMGKDGRPEKYVSIRTDITAIKLASQQLARERQRLDNILRGTNVGTWEWRVDSGLNEVNERWAEMLGYTPAELMPVTDEAWAALVQADDLARARATLAQHLAGHRDDYEAELRMRHKDGHWVWVHSRGRLVERAADGSPLLVAGTHMDITLRKRAEEALRSSNERLRVILDNLPCGLSVFDAELHMIGCNDEFRDLLSLPAELFDKPVVTFESIIRHNALHGEYGAVDVETTVAEIVERARHPVPHHFERTRPDGRVLEVRGAPLPGGGFVTTYTNVTERRQAEAAVQEREHLLRLVTDNIPGRLTYFDAQHRLKFANKASYAFYGGSPDISVGATFEAFVGSPHAGAQRAWIDQVLAGQPQTYDFERTLPDGEVAYSVVHLIPDVREGVVCGFIGMAIDVTPLRRAEQEARRAETLLRGAIDAVNEAFVLYDPQDRLVFCNDKYRELYATSADLIVPGASFEHILRIGAQRGQYKEAIGRVDEWVAERMQAHRAADSTMVQKLDDGRWLRIVERKMPDGHTVGFRIDITDLMKATEAAEAASRSKSQFLANMSHEIRTPMNAILGMLKLLNNTELTARQRDYTDKTERAARALLGLLNDILDFSKVEAGKLELDPRPFRLDRLMRDLSVILSANLGAKPVEVLFDIDPAVPRALVGDDLRLNQVLINLGGNAIKFTQAGEVVIGVRLAELGPTRARLEFSVRDTGIGIAPEHQQRIFDGFSQAEASTTRRFGGTGLGLSICQRLVSLMGGEISFSSTLGQGSRFSFTLPLDIAQADDAPDTGGAAPPALRVLVVDDHPTAREVLTTMAQSLGWQVGVAEGGEQAVEMVRRQVATGQPYEAVFVDWQMPGLDGWETSQRIRSLSGDQAPLLMMVTAQGRARLAERPAADQALLSGYLVKPVTASMLLDAVVDARAARGELHPSLASALAAGQLAPGGMPRLQGLRLLVVEDNANNQQVAQELLESEGARVTLAADGRQGVEAVASADPPFDAVLMDIQMPVMDGYTATEMIRRDWAADALPIIAMTANAMASDRAACLAAGMNDHVGKPFDLDQLVQTLRRHVRRAPQAGAGDGVTTGAGRRARVELPQPLVDDAMACGIDLAGALGRMSGRADVLLRMAGSFVQSLPGAADELAQRLTSGCREDAARQMHTLKGLAATLGAMRLSELAAEAEKALDSAAPAPEDATWPARLRELAARTGDDFARLIPLMQAATAPAEAGPAAALDHGALRQLLGRLIRLLKDMDMAATDVFAELQQACGAQAPAGLTALGDAIAALDFENALAQCATLDVAWKT